MDPKRELAKHPSVSGIKALRLFEGLIVLTRNRIGLLLILGLAPIFFLMGVGSYHLWITGWGFWAWVPTTLCMASTYTLGRYWTRKSKVDLPQAQHLQAPPNYWSKRDNQAWALVWAKADTVDDRPLDQFFDTETFAKEAHDLALIIARVYRPGASDPFGHLTLPEIFTCMELVARDVADKVTKYVPGSHLLKVHDLRRIRQLSDWYTIGQNAYWLASAIFNPVKTGLHFSASKFGLGPQLKKLQSNVLVWLRSVYLLEFGRHLIELNSGRLKVGTDRYRELIALSQVPPSGPETIPMDVPVKQPVVLDAQGKPAGTTFEQETKKGRYKRVAHQIANAGKQTLHCIWDYVRKKPNPSAS